MDLGFCIKGTSDVALVQQMCWEGMQGADGTMWIWEIKKHIKLPTQQVKFVLAIPY